MMELYYGDNTLPYDKDPRDPQGVFAAPWDLQDSPETPLGPPMDAPGPPGDAPGTSHGRPGKPPGTP